MIKFNPNIPVAESRLQSSPIRDNFNALNDRTDQLTASATSPVSTNLVIGKADKVYFENNTFAPFSGTLLQLGSSTLGVSSFISKGTFKEVIVYYSYDSVLGGVIGFIESEEKTVREQSSVTTAQLINDYTLQRVPNPTTRVSTPVTSNQLLNAVLICSVVVTNNSQTNVGGAINPIFDSDVVDIRPFVQRTTNTQDLLNHINEPTLAAAHPQARITNSIINTSASIATTSVTNSNTIQVAFPALFDPAIIGYKCFVRLTNDTETTAKTSFVTAQVQSVVGSLITLDRPVSTTANTTQVVRGEITLDKVVFDVVDQMSDLFQRSPLTGLVQFKPSTNITVNSVTGSLIGNASTASKWNNPITLTLSGGVTGSVSFDGYNNVSLNTSIGSDAVTLGTNTTGNYVTTITGTTNQVNVSGSGTESANVTLSLPQNIHTAATPTFQTLTLGGASLSTTSLTFNLINTTATTLNIGGAATTLSLGAGSGTTTVNNNLIVNGGVISTSASTASVFNTTPTTLNIGGAATTLSLGAGSGTTTVNNSLAVSGNTLSTSSTTFSLLNTPTTLNIGAAATILSLGAGSGTTTVNNSLTATGTLTMSAGMKKAVKTVGTSYNVNSTDNVIIVTASTTITLPSASTNTQSVFTIKATATTTVTVGSTGGTVDQTSITAGTAKTYISDGTNWYAI